MRRNKNNPEEVVSDDNEERSLDARIEETVRIKLETVVSELAVVVHQQVEKSAQRVGEGRFGELRASVFRTLEAEYTLVKNECVPGMPYFFVYVIRHIYRRI